MQAHVSQNSSGRRKTSKYFATDKQKPKDEKETQQLPAKRKTQKDNDESEKPPPTKKVHIIDDDDDFVLSSNRKNSVDVTLGKKLKSGWGRGIATKPAAIEEGDEDDTKNIGSPLKSGGRGCGGGGSSAVPADQRGRGGGLGGFMNFGVRKDPPHKGEKVKNIENLWID